MIRTSLTVLSIFILAVTFSSPLFSQAANGSISGTVVDATGAVVPGAEVTVTNQGTDKTITQITSEGGAFSFPSLVVGPYTLRATLPGFTTFVATDIKVDVGRDYGLTVRLELGEVTQEVIVTAGQEIVQKTDAKISTTIGKEQIEKLPLNGRNPVALITLNAGTASNGRTNTAIAGNRTSFTSISMDGVNIQDNFIRSNATDFVPARPTTANVAEFTITTQNQGSESGFGSNQVNLVTPSGSNSYHGDLYLFHRNSAQAANDFFDNRNGIPLPQLIRNQFGGSASGPIIKDRLLFFFNYEGQRISQQSSRNNTVLTPDARQGIFTYQDSAGMISQLNLLQATGVSIDPFISNYLNLVPTTINNFDVGDSAANQLRNTAGFSFVQRSNNMRDQYKIRLDYILNDKHSFEGVLQELKNVDDRPDIDTSFNAIPVVQSGTGAQYSDFFSAAWKYTVTPNILNEVRFGGFLSPVVFTTSENFAAGFKVTGLPFSNPVEDFENQGRFTDTWTVQDNASWQRGEHSFRFGFQSNFIRANSFSCFDCTPEYDLDFSTAQTIGLTTGDFPGGISSSQLATANNLLSTLGGFLNTGTQDFVVADRSNPVFTPQTDDKTWEYDTYALYFGDNWRLHPRFTLNLGLRWEYTPNFKESNGLIVQAILQPGQTIRDLAFDPNAVFDFVEGDLINPDYNNFAPNVGFAWDLFGDSKTVLRAGYGISYVNDEAIRAIDGWLNRFGIAATPSIVQLTSTISQGVPAIPVPDFELPLSLATIRENDVAGAGVFSIDPDIKLPYVQTWNLGIQREVGWDTAVEFRYVGTKGTALLRGIDFNQVDVLNNGFLEDFLRAQQNGFLAQAATGTFDPRFNADIAGSQQLTIFPTLPGAGLLTNSTVRSNIQQGRVGNLAFVYQSNGLDGGFPFTPNPNANFSDIATNQASSIYHGLQIEARRRFKAGLSFNANYTFSKVLTDASGVAQTNFEPFVDINNPGYDRGRADFDLTHVFNANFLFELPFGQGRRYDFGNSIANQFLGGWNLTSIFNWQSGAPFGIVAPRGTLNRDGRSGNNNANSTLDNSGIRNLFGVVESGGNIYYINPSVTTSNGRAVAADGAAAFAGQVFFNPDPGTLGTLPKNGFSGPQFFNWDFGVAKTFGVTEDVNVEFRTEFFNFLNNVNFDVPNTYDVNSTNFGQIVQTVGSPRVIQFALKINW